MQTIAAAEFMGTETTDSALSQWYAAYDVAGYDDFGRTAATLLHDAELIEAIREREALNAKGLHGWSGSTDLGVLRREALTRGIEA